MRRVRVNIQVFHTSQTGIRMDFEHARFNMVEQQIRTWDVLDPAVLELLGKEETLKRMNNRLTDFPD